MFFVVGLYIGNIIIVIYVYVMFFWVIGMEMILVFVNWLLRDGGENF